jgi:hypothetical protein
VARAEVAGGNVTIDAPLPELVVMISLPLPVSPVLVLSPRLAEEEENDLMDVTVDGEDCGEADSGMDNEGMTTDDEEIEEEEKKDPEEGEDGAREREVVARMEEDREDWGGTEEEEAKREEADKEEEEEEPADVEE